MTFRGQLLRDLGMLAQLLSPPLVKKFVLKLVFKATIGKGAQVGWFSAVSGRRITLGKHSNVRPLTLIRCAGSISIGKYAEVSSLTLIYGAGSLDIGDHSYVGPQCLIDTTEPVHIGHSSALGPRCMVFSHGSFLPYTRGYPVKFAGVSIGDRAWLAAGVFVHPGVTIGSDVFINSRAVIAADIPCNAVAEGAPARVVLPLRRFRRHMTSEKVDKTIDQVIDRFATVVLQGEMELGIERNGAGLSFHYRRQRYLVASVPATPAGNSRELPPCENGTRCLFISNRPDWRPPAFVRDFALFDLHTMKVVALSDPVHEKLLHFMKRYYGLQFEYEEKP